MAYKSDENIEQIVQDGIASGDIKAGVISKLFQGIDTTGGLKLTNVPQTIEYDFETIKDDYYTHSTATNPGEVTINQTGHYKITASITVSVVDASQGIRGNPRMHIDIDSGSGWVTQPDEMGGYTRENSAGLLSESITGIGIFSFTAGDKIRITTFDSVPDEPNEETQPFSQRLILEYIDRSGGQDFIAVANHSDLSLNDGTNPHSTTKSDVGLGNADNTSDVDKPVSTAQQTALDGKKDDFTENTAFNKDFGTTAGTVLEGDTFIPSVNPTDKKLPYNNAGTFADSPITYDSGTDLITVNAETQLSDGGEEVLKTEYTTFPKVIIGNDTTTFSQITGRSLQIQGQSGDLILQTLAGGVRLDPSTTSDIMQTGLYQNVYNNSGALISKGSVVYDNGYNATEDAINIGLADADGVGTMPSLGIVSADIANNASGEVCVFGYITDIDTSAFSQGDALFVSETAGVLTTTQPTGEASGIQEIARVIQSNASGKILVIGANRTNALPNLNQDKIWIGDSNNAPTAFQFLLSGSNQLSDSQSSPALGDWGEFLDTATFGTIASGRIPINATGGSSHRAVVYHDRLISDGAMFAGFNIASGRTTANQYIYLKGRWGGANNKGYRFDVQVGTTNNVLLRRIDGVTDPTIGTTSFTIATDTDYYCAVECKGTDIEIYLSTTPTLPTTATLEVSDSVYTGGYFEIEFFDNNNGSGTGIAELIAPLEAYTAVKGLNI